MAMTVLHCMTQFMDDRPLQGKIRNSIIQKRFVNFDPVCPVYPIRNASPPGGSQQRIYPDSSDLSGFNAGVIANHFTLAQ